VSGGIPETTIFYDPATGHYGFSTRFPGQHPHHMINTFDSVDAVLRWCDPHRECIWEEASGFKEGTVAWRMAHLTLSELSARSRFSGPAVRTRAPRRSRPKKDPR
jgi:hypothetical protein